MYALMTQSSDSQNKKQKSLCLQAITKTTLIALWSGDWSRAFRLVSQYTTPAYRYEVCDLASAIFQAPREGYSRLAVMAFTACCH